MPDPGAGGPYRPIACSAHDRLEAAATLGRSVRLVFRMPDGSVQTVDDRLEDVFTRNGEELVRTAAGRLIRLDRLESLDGVTLR